MRGSAALQIQRKNRALRNDHFAILTVREFP